MNNMAMLVAKMVGSTTYYLHQDHLGTTRLNMTCLRPPTVSFSSNYVQYGNNYAVSGKEVFMYTGKPQDSVTGLTYFGARYYDPTTGRFVTQDSNRGNKNDPMTMNLYVYARDNPERYVDPTGHFILVSVTTVEGMDPRPWAILQPAPALTDLHKVAYGSAGSSSPGASVKSVDVTLTQQGQNQYANTPTIGLGGGPSSASLIIVSSTYKLIELNPDEQAGLNKMGQNAEMTGLGLYLTVGGLVETAGGVIGFREGDPEAGAELALGNQDYNTGTQDLSKSGPGFVSGLGQFVYGMFEYLKF